MYYIVVILAAKFGSIKSPQMWLEIYMFGVSIIHNVVHILS